MFQHLKRQLMNEVDTGSGNGAATPSTSTPTADVSQAQGAPAITKEIADVIASTVSKAVADVKDSIFAEARRTFAGKQNKTKTDDAPPTVNQPTQVDPFKMRKLDFALNKAGIAADLTQTQYERAHRDFAVESPDDAESWIKDYFHGHGKFAAPVQAQTAPVTQTVSQTQPPTRTAPPVSDRGSPPVSAVPLEDQDIIAMSPSDREALRRQKGDKWFTDKLLEQSKRHSYKLR